MASLDELARSVVDALRHHSQTISFCESLTAGLAAATLANIPGASDVLRGGLVVYATELKASLARVPEEVIDKHGPVSAVTAKEMARGTRGVCGSDWAVAITGVAGPEPQDDHAVGEVWVGLAGPRWTASAPAGGLVPIEQSKFALIEGSAEPARVLAGDRAQIRRASVEAALMGVLTGVREQKSRSERLNP